MKTRTPYEHVERGGGRPTSGDADLFADEVVRKVLRLRNKIAYE